MIVLPNSYSRYLASLRYFTSFNIFKNGLKDRYLKNLKKIYLAEAIFNKNFTESIDINKLSNNILGATKYLKPNIKYKIKSNGTYLVNKNLFSYLLLDIIKNHSLVLSAKENYLCIKFKGKNLPTLSIISALDGYIFREIKTTENLLIIPTEKTNRKSSYCDSEWEYLFDKFSIVNLFFLNIY